MRVIKFLFLTILILTLSYCGNTTNLNTNEIALKLAVMEEKGLVSQSEKREAFLLFFQSEIISYFESQGFGYRIGENAETWRTYSDNNYFILTGSVAKTDNDIYIFTSVYKGIGNGFELIYAQVGDKKYGQYPENIIPN